MCVRDVRAAGWIGLCCITVVVGCRSSDKAGPELGDAASFDQLGSDTTASTDAPIDQQAQDVSVSLDMRVDSAGWDAPWPSTDVPLQIVDAPRGDDAGARPDGHYFTIPDGRQLLQVDYCLPIFPLSSGSRHCPATLDDARAALSFALDGGALDAHPLLVPAMSEPCVEPLVVYLPYGYAFGGWGTTCYYDSNSAQLLSIVTGTDTPTECVDSPIPNTAAFIAQVFGKLVTCTWPGPGRG